MPIITPTPRTTHAALTDRDTGMHAKSTTRLFPQSGKTGTTVEPIALQQRV
ncbi:hypothetical protein [Komagataeibacter xylinus]|uniref:hypothetical protein n=1 Tax=Komagataeibacter xylinus TaxID=28448 RepID=UPI0013304A51|nr:hypothetical protein [Komagataeibacter xylinus]